MRIKVMSRTIQLCSRRQHEFEDEYSITGMVIQISIPHLLHFILYGLYLMSIIIYYCTFAEQKATI